MAARKASNIVSRLTATASGPGWPAASSSRSESGYGCIHGSAAADGPGPAGAGTARRASRRSVSRQELVATRYSQVRGLAWPWKRSRERQTRRNTSCT